MSAPNEPQPIGPAGYTSAVAPGDQPRVATIATLDRRRWVTIVPRAVLLLLLIGSLTALAVGVVVVVAALVLAATAG